MSYIISHNLTEPHRAWTFGMPDYANRDFICFASPLAGAAGYYLACEEWAERISARGYETLFVYESGERRILATVH